jgi:hypothetical protein
MLSHRFLGSWCAWWPLVPADAFPSLPPTSAHLRLTDVTAWRALRQSLDYRHECRRAQLRFRRDPQVYLAALEQRLLTLCDSPSNLTAPETS